MMIMVVVTQMVVVRKKSSGKDCYMPSKSQEVRRRDHDMNELELSKDKFPKSE